ncbi:MAG: hypothetical protein ACOCRO_02980 [Halanaerobiales bacterium]
MGKEKLNLEVDINFEPKKAHAFELPDNNVDSRYFFLGTLCHAKPESEGDKPIANANGQTFLATTEDAPDFMETDDVLGLKEAANTVVDAFLNLFHDPTYTVGHIKKAKFIEETEEEAAHIDFVGVLQKDILDKYDISKQDIRSGRFRVSMETYYNKWFYIWGDKEIEPTENPELDEYVGETYQNLGVVEVICNPEFSAAGLIPSGNEADKNAIIKSVASKAKGAADRLLSNPRTPNYDGVSTASWDRPDLSTCIKGYYQNHDEDKPDDLTEEVEELPNKVKSWIAELGSLGKDSADSFNDLLILPVVNPINHKLVENALNSAKGYVAQVNGIDEDLEQSTKNKIDSLLEKEFDNNTNDNNSEGSNDNMGDIFKKLEFETEEEYQEFLDEQRDGFVKAEKVVAQLNDIGLEGSNLEEVGDSIKQLKDDLREAKADKVFQQRKQKLANVGVEVEEEDKEDIVSLTDSQFKLMVKAQKQTKASDDQKDDKDLNFNILNGDSDDNIDNPLKSLA